MPALHCSRATRCTFQWLHARSTPLGCLRPGFSAFAGMRILEFVPVGIVIIRHTQRAGNTVFYRCRFPSSRFAFSTPGFCDSPVK